jgi:hypothetical protein
MKVRVCEHALQQWHKRFGAEAGVGLEALLAAFGQAQQPELLPFGRKSGTHYYYHAGLACWFVVEPLSKDEVTIRTVYRREGPTAISARGVLRLDCGPEVGGRIVRIRELQRLLGGRKYRNQPAERAKLVEELVELQKAQEAYYLGSN